ncbi:MAG: TIGR03668 family PPOX class F420-dependent oxidoreductase, partial [Actinobacteria bacterium]|nr:TIGR03668 family PPOX class F420-dependent oxidoreductase [Actinomycetota bacterium]
KNIARDDRVALLIDHWDEDWKRLAWLMVRGRAVVDPDASMDVMRELNERYPQYDVEQRHDALIRIRPTRLSWWAWS